MKKEKTDRDIPYIPLTRDKFDMLGMSLIDPMGSYTGLPADPYEVPVQDADDL